MKAFLNYMKAIGGLSVNLKSHLPEIRILSVGVVLAMEMQLFKLFTTKKINISHK